MFVVSVAAAAISGHLGVEALTVPALVLWLMALAFSLLLITASLSTRFRDMSAALPLVIQAGIFVTPVAYSLTGVPHNIQTLLILNPVTGLIEAWRWGLLGITPNVASLIVAGIWTVSLAVAGWRTFVRMELEFADYV